MNVELKMFEKQLDTVKIFRVGNSKDNYDETENIIKNYIDNGVVRPNDYSFLAESYHTHLVQVLQYLNKIIDITSESKYDKLLTNHIYDKIESASKQISKISNKTSNKATINVCGNRLFYGDSIYMYDRLLRLYNTQIYFIENRNMYLKKEIENRNTLRKIHKELNKEVLDALSVLVIVWYIFFKKEDTFIQYIEKTISLY